MKEKSQFDALCWEVSKQYWRALGKPEMIKFIKSVAEKRQKQNDEELDSRNLKELAKLANELNAEKHPDIPPHVLVKKKFSDTTANDLTKTIIYDMYWVRQGVAYRINNGAVFDRKKACTEKGVQRRGIPDIIGIIDGRFFGIEVKIGKDRQSADQKEIEREVNDAGGVYFIAKSYDDYLTKIAQHDSGKP